MSSETIIAPAGAPITPLIPSRTSWLVCYAFAALAALPIAVEAQQAPAARRGSVALETDILAYGINGTSGILNVSFANGWQIAAGAGSYDVPKFLLEGDPNFHTAEWKARSTSVQVARATYRFKGANRNGLALGGVVLNQKWRLSSAKLDGTSTFRPLSMGVTAGYYQHFGKRFYIYPTTAFTYNRVISGDASVKGTAYRVNKFAPNASLHIGWEIAR